MLLQQLFITLLLTSHLASSASKKYTDRDSESKLALEDEFEGHFSDPSAKAGVLTVS